MRRSLIGKRRGDGPSPFANVEVHLLETRLESKHHAVTNVDSVGVIEHFTFADVAREAGRWAHVLRANGHQPGDRVLVLAGREWAWRCALLGVLRAGGVAVPCPATLPVEEIRAIAAGAGAGHLISIPARGDLAEADGLVVLDADGVDAIDASTALREPAHESRRDDVALVLYGRDGLRGAMHTHASLIAQADAGTHWLGVGENEPVWCTAANGSPESIWLLLAGWQEGANIVNVELDLDPEATLELLGRLGTAAVWFSDEEYARLESAAPAAWINGSINRALVSDERSSGAAAFANAVDADVAAIFGVAELGVVAGWPAGTDGEDTAETARPVPGIELAVLGDEGLRLPTGLVGDVVVRGDAPSLVVGYAGSEDGVPQNGGWFRFGWRGALAADGALRLASRSPAELELVDAGAEADERRRREEEEARRLVAAAVAAAAAEAESARREAAAAEERRQADEAERARREAAAAEEERRREEEARRRAEQDAQRLAEAAATAEALRAAAAAEERRRAEEEQRREEERRREEEARRRAEQEAEATAVAEREAEERRRAEEEQRREEERRRQEEAKRLEEREAREREQAEAVAAAATHRAVAEAAEKEQGPDADGGGQVGHTVLLGSGVVSEISGSSAGAAAAPGDHTYTAGATEAGAGVVQTKPGAAEPAWRHPGVRAWQLLAVVLVLVIGALLAAYFLQGPQRTATRTVMVPTASAATLARVPDVVNQEAGSGRAMLGEAGFKSRVQTVPAPAAAGVVIQEKPAAGTKVRRGSAITLRVSVGKAATTRLAKRVIVPNVFRLEQAAARRNLSAAGLRARIWYVPSQVPRGQVTGQSPAARARVRRGTKVLLAVSRGH